MADQLARGLTSAWDHTPPKLSQGGRSGGGTPQHAAAATPPNRPTLTEIFNHAADPSVQIELLRRKLSRPAPTLDYAAKGSVVRSINPKRDRQIQSTINSLSHVVSKTVNQTPPLKVEIGKKMTMTPHFNKHAGRRP